jgi:uncharacterized protein YcbK (DUF882 family)
MLFPSLLPLAAIGWFTATPADPSRVVDATLAATDQAAEALAAEAVEVTLFDINHQERKSVRIGRDGSVDVQTRTTLERLFRCKRTERRHAVDDGLLLMLADVASRYPGKTIEYVSAFRARDRHTSRHRQGRALDFRIPGVPTTELRDYVWTHHSRLGLGWYPEGDFIHMDHRPGDADYAWTHTGGRDRGNPSWARELRVSRHKRPRVDRVGT